MLYAWILYTCFFVIERNKNPYEETDIIYVKHTSNKKNIQQWIERQNGALGCFSFQAITWPSSVTSLRGLNVFFSIAATQLMVIPRILEQDPLNGPRQKPE